MATASSTKSPAQMFALAFGAVYLLVGVVGFLITGFDDFAAETGEKLILFGINPLHNIVHIAVGALWLGAASSHSSAKSVNLLVGVVYGLVGLLGIVGVLDFINHNPADAGLHIVSAAASLYFGTAGAEGTTRATA